MRLIQTIHAHEELRTMKFSHTGEYLATAGQEIVWVWRRQGGRRAEHLKARAVQGVRRAQRGHPRPVLEPHRLALVFEHGQDCSTVVHDHGRVPADLFAPGLRHRDRL